MKFRALATDYDGTLAHGGVVEANVLAVLRRLRQAGQHLILLTGRQLPDLIRVFPHLEFFDRVVAENGALLYRPAGREERRLAKAPPPAFLQRLKNRGIDDISTGRVIIATHQPYGSEVLKVIKEMGLDLSVVLNKGAVMALPAGVNKATGLLAALDELGVHSEETVGIGDAENDQDFLAVCGRSAAVANALPELKERVDLVARKDNGAGVVELIEAFFT